jgi:hypothetical protein
MTTSSALVKTGRYVQGGLTEVGKLGLEWWDRYSFELDETDQIFTVSNSYVNRIDLIADTFYGEPRFWWIIAQYNNILDPWAEITIGRQLRLPTLNRLQLLFNKKTGGIKSSRTPESVLPPIVL